MCPIDAVAGKRKGKGYGGRPGQPADRAARVDDFLGHPRGRRGELRSGVRRRVAHAQPGVRDAVRADRKACRVQLPDFVHRQVRPPLGQKSLRVHAQQATGRLDRRLVVDRQGQQVPAQGVSRRHGRLPAAGRNARVRGPDGVQLLAHFGQLAVAVRAGGCQAQRDLVAVKQTLVVQEVNGAEEDGGQTMFLQQGRDQGKVLAQTVVKGQQDGRAAPGRGPNGAGAARAV